MKESTPEWCREGRRAWRGSWQKELTYEALPNDCPPATSTKSVFLRLNSTSPMTINNFVFTVASQAVRWCFLSYQPLLSLAECLPPSSSAEHARQYVDDYFIHTLPGIDHYKTSRSYLVPALGIDISLTTTTEALWGWVCTLTEPPTEDCYKRQIVTCFYQFRTMARSNGRFESSPSFIPLLLVSFRSDRAWVVVSFCSIVQRDGGIAEGFSSGWRRASQEKADGSQRE